MAVDDQHTDELMTYQEFMVLRLMEKGASYFMAQEAVASTLIDMTPEFSENDRRTYTEWVSR